MHHDIRGQRRSGLDPTTADRTGDQCRAHPFTSARAAWGTRYQIRERRLTVQVNITIAPQQICTMKMQCGKDWRTSRSRSDHSRSHSRCQARLSPQNALHWTQSGQKQGQAVAIGKKVARPQIPKICTASVIRGFVALSEARICRSRHCLVTAAHTENLCATSLLMWTKLLRDVRRAHGTHVAHDMNLP